MLLSQVASELNKQHLDAFHNAFFPSGKVSKSDILNETLSDLGVKTVQNTDDKKPINGLKTDSQPANPQESTTKKGVVNISRKQRRSEERLSKKLEKSAVKVDERRKSESDAFKTRLQSIRREMEAETKTANEERLKRVLGF